MKTATFLLALPGFTSLGVAVPESLDPTVKYTAIVLSHVDVYEIRPIPEDLKAPEGLSIHVEAVKDGSATCLLINNTGKPVYCMGEQESTIYHLEKRSEVGKWVDLEMWMDCADGLTQTTLPSQHCRRFQIEARDPLVRVKLDCYPKLPEKKEDLAFNETVWSKELLWEIRSPLPHRPRNSSPPRP